MIAAFHIFASLLLGLGCVIVLTSALGMHRLPDFYSRIHAAGKTDSLGQLLITTALLIEAGIHGNLSAGLKLLLISAFLLISTPASTHAIAQAAFLNGLRPWTRPKAPATEDAPAEASEPTEPASGEPEPA